MNGWKIRHGGGMGMETKKRVPVPKMKFKKDRKENVKKNRFQNEANKKYQEIQKKAKRFAWPIKFQSTFFIYYPGAFKHLTLISIWH